MIRATIIVAIASLLYLSGVAIAASELEIAKRTLPKPPTSCQDCKPALANASDCE